MTEKEEEKKIKEFVIFEIEDFKKFIKVYIPNFYLTEEDHNIGYLNIIQELKGYKFCNDELFASKKVVDFLNKMSTELMEDYNASCGECLVPSGEGCDFNNRFEEESNIIEAKTEEIFIIGEDQ